MVFEVGEKSRSNEETSLKTFIECDWRWLSSKVVYEVV